MAIAHPKLVISPEHGHRLRRILTLWRIGSLCARFDPADHADVAQLVARNLAKVQVAGSNPVVRSDRASFENIERRFLSTAEGLREIGSPKFRGGMAERRGKGLQIPLHGFKSRFHLHEESI